MRPIINAAQRHFSTFFWRKTGKCAIFSKQCNALLELCKNWRRWTKGKHKNWILLSKIHSLSFHAIRCAIVCCCCCCCVRVFFFVFIMEQLLLLLEHWNAARKVNAKATIVYAVFILLSFFLSLRLRSLLASLIFCSFPSRKYPFAFHTQKTNVYALNWRTEIQ